MSCRDICGKEVVCPYEPPPPHIAMNIHNEEKVRKPSQVHEAGKSVGYATSAACLVYGVELAIIGVFRTDTPPLYHKYLCMTLIGFLFCGISISMMLNDKIRFRVQSHRGCYIVYAFYALAIATLMVVVMLTKFKLVFKLTPVSDTIKGEVNEVNGNKRAGDLAAIDTPISYKDHALLLLTCLPSSYDNFVETLLYGRDTLKLEYMVVILNSRELQKITEAKGDGGEGLYVRGKSSQRDMEQGTYSAWSKSQGRSSRLMCYICQFNKHLKRDCPRYNYKKSQGFVRNKDQVSGSEADGYESTDVIMAMSVSIDAGGSYHIIYMRDYLVDFKEYDGNKILLGDGRECRVRGTGKVRVQMRDGGFDREYVVGQDQGYKGLAGGTIRNNKGIKQGMLEPAKVKCIFMGYRKGTMDNKLKRMYDVTSNVLLYKNVSFNESREYKKTFVGSGVARDRKQHSAWELFNYREDSNKAAFAVAAMDKIYAHKSLTFNDTIAYESRFYNEKLVQTFLEGHSTLSLEGSLSRDCDVEKNDMGMLDKFDHGLQTDVQVFMDFDYSMRRSITVMRRSITSGVHDTYKGYKEGYLAKGTRNRVKIRAKDSSGYCYRCLVKGYPWSKVPT
nr:retrovirus-related Pol polyprotein from transposon TNT 1-94 [Tanacetum cinerariifolium]